MQEARKTAIVIGGGPAGMEAALKIGQAGYKAILVEKEPVLGGRLGSLCGSFPRWESPDKIIENKIHQIKQCSQVEVLPDTVVSSCEHMENGFAVVLKNGAGDERKIEVGGVILATGFEFFDAKNYGEYGYGIYPEVITAIEFEAQLKEWQSGRDINKKPGAVAFIKCVGSRDRAKGYPYCSKICCMYTAKQAGMVKDLFPESDCYVFYMDYRAAGKEYEEFVRSVIEDKKVRYVRGRPAKVLPVEGRLLVRVEDTLMGIPTETKVDIVVLASGTVPSKESTELANLFGAKTDEHGFMEPEFGYTSKAGLRVYYAGGCGFPVEIAGAQQQGAAAAAEIISLFNQEYAKG